MKPNILVVVADQLRYDCTGFASKYPVATPNIDRIAVEGAWFSHAYTPIPVCCPSRQALLTGLRPERFGILCNYDFMKARGLCPNEWTWTSEMAQMGYQMGFIGKWQAHPDYDATAYGYTDYIGLAEYSSYRRQKYPNSTPPPGWAGGVDPIPFEDSRPYWLVSQAISVLSKYTSSTKPWHIRLDFPEPHLPCTPSSLYADMYQAASIPAWGSFNDDLKGKPFIQRQQLYSWGIENWTWVDWAPIVARYYATITQIDACIGMLLDSLDCLGASRDTLVIFTADHGDMCGGHRMMDKHCVMYDDIVRVPLILRWIGSIPGNQQREEMVSSSLDLAATISEATGCTRLSELDGRSLLQLCYGENTSAWRQDILSTYNGQQFGLYNQRMLRTHDWKYIWNATDVDELYDMKSDPYELINLTEHPSSLDVLAGMRRTLFERLIECDDLMVGENNPWTKTQLLEGRKAPSITTIAPDAYNSI